MRRGTAAAITSLFFAMAPGVVAGVVPWAITHWRFRHLSTAWLPARVLGGVLVCASAIVLVEAFIRFVVEGRGTPAPPAPTAVLVVGGLYRYVRNPMYLAVVGSIVGQSLLFGQPALLAYGAVIFVTVAAFAEGYEKPVLAEKFGVQYAAYCDAVPAWWPRLRPWSPDSESRPSDSG